MSETREGPELWEWQGRHRHYEALTPGISQIERRKEGLLRHGHGSYGLIVRQHDVIAIRVVTDAGDPRWIWRAGKGDCGKQNQHRKDRKEGRDPPILGRGRPSRSHRLLPT